jgi:pimeloyl-ACP methyl ester carboxylesterase
VHDLDRDSDGEDEITDSQPFKEGPLMRIPIDFVSEGYKIQGKFYLATGEPTFPTVLLLTGLPGNEDDVIELGQRMSQCGINVLTFNYRGTHRSEGAYSLRGTLEDIRAAIEYLRQERVTSEFRIDTGKLVLGGYSYGGGMALAYAAGHPEIQRVFSIVGNDHGEFVREYKRNPAFAEMIDLMFEELKSPAGPVRFAGEAPIDELARDPAPYDLRLNATALADRDILLIGAWDDPNVTIEHYVLPLYRALVDANAKVQIAAFQDNHAFESSREELAATVVRWVKSS